MSEHLVHRLSRHLAADCDLPGGAAERIARAALGFIARQGADAGARVDVEAAMRWADRHEASERRKLRDMGLSPEGDMPTPGAWFVQNLVAEVSALRALPTPTSTEGGK